MVTGASYRSPQISQRKEPSRPRKPGATGSGGKSVGSGTSSKFIVTDCHIARICQSKSWIASLAFWRRTRGRSSSAQGTLHYHRLSTDTSTTTSSSRLRVANAFDPVYVANRISDNHNIPCHVRILEIISSFGDDPGDTLHRVKNLLKELAKTLLMFPALESIMLIARRPTPIFNLPLVFRTALENRLNLPTMKELHVHDCCFPISILANSKYISHLSLSGFSTVHQNGESSLLRLKSLSLEIFNFTNSNLDGLKRPLHELRSLKYSDETLDILLDLIQVCRRTLNKLEIELTNYARKVSSLTVTLLLIFQILWILFQNLSTFRTSISSLFGWQ